MEEKKKNIIIIVLVVLLLVSIATICYLIINKNNTIEEITGTVTEANEKYLIITSEKEDYLINDAKENYSSGDKVKFKYKSKNMNKKTTPKTIKIDDEELLEKVENQEDNNIDKPIDSNNQKPVIPSNTKTADTEVIEYLEKLEKDIDSDSIKDSLKSGFITVVDFIFYDGTIKGHTFKELSDSAKLKVLNLALYLDKKIDTYFPDYKKSISNKTGKIYTSVKNEIITTYLNVTVKVCETNEELCSSAKSGFQKLKKNLGLTWSLIKDIAGDGVDNIRKWYEIFSGK